jgi:hypothetical protein
VISAEQVDDAVQALHAAFELGEGAIRPEETAGDHRPTITPG